MMDFILPAWQVIAIAAVGTVVVAVAGGVMTDTTGWYRTLRFPAWKPPDWAFGPIWTTILALVALSAAIAWEGASSSLERTIVSGLFVLNGLLNILWNYLFFFIRRPDLAMVEVAFLWLSILALVVATYPINRAASLMLVPYLVWVGIASALNRSIVRMNGPFAGA
ncbi:TspO/MBR family protein [Phreatobacter oligotrophus]|uniref:TspO/MBR related protein n=1 Tax=Phreatobacter oligotrophus TaxID=1122261 RepID=A0A2T4Z2I0_9HYPH|nr:TspO/MBR family protein [Phreatobacter oligotrophus]PTM54989.1 TspO/MBR related protein [Phreatobacter oligotrophus]